MNFFIGLQKAGVGNPYHDHKGKFTSKELAVPANLNQTFQFPGNSTHLGNSLMQAVAAYMQQTKWAGKTHIAQAELWKLLMKHPDWTTEQKGKYLFKQLKEHPDFQELQGDGKTVKTNVFGQGLMALFDSHHTDKATAEVPPVHPSLAPGKALSTPPVGDGGGFKPTSIHTNTPNTFDVQIKINNAVTQALDEFNNKNGQDKNSGDMIAKHVGPIVNALPVDDATKVAMMNQAHDDFLTAKGFELVAKKPFSSVADFAPKPEPAKPAGPTVVGTWQPPKPDPVYPHLTEKDVIAAKYYLGQHGYTDGQVENILNQANEHVSHRVYMSTPEAVSGLADLNGTMPEDQVKAFKAQWGEYWKGKISPPAPSAAPAQVTPAMSPSWPNIVQSDAAYLVADIPAQHMGDMDKFKAFMAAANNHAEFYKKKGASTESASKKGISDALLDNALKLPDGLVLSLHDKWLDAADPTKGQGAKAPVTSMPAGNVIASSTPTSMSGTPIGLASPFDAWTNINTEYQKKFSGSNIGDQAGEYLYDFVKPNSTAQEVYNHVATKINAQYNTDKPAGAIYKDKVTYALDVTAKQLGLDPWDASAAFAAKSAPTTPAAAPAPSNLNDKHPSYPNLTHGQVQAIATGFALTYPGEDVSGKIAANTGSINQKVGNGMSLTEAVNASLYKSKAAVRTELAKLTAASSAPATAPNATWTPDTFAAAVKAKYIEKAKAAGYPSTTGLAVEKWASTMYAPGKPAIEISANIVGNIAMPDTKKKLVHEAVAEVLGGSIATASSVPKILDASNYPHLKPEHIASLDNAAQAVGMDKATLANVAWVANSEIGKGYKPEQALITAAHTYGGVWSQVLADHISAANGVPKNVVATNNTKPPSLVTAKPIAIEHISDFTEVAAKPGGSQPGAIYKDASGQKWLIKGNSQVVNGTYDHVEGEKRARSEVLTAALMNAVSPGSAPEMKLVNLSGKYGGGVGVATKWVDGLVPYNKSNSLQTEAIATKMFAPAAWLANWDVIGQQFDNTMFKGGVPFHVDPGAGMYYRAMGEKKDFPADKVVEFDTLRDPTKNSKAAHVFGTMTKMQMQASFDPLEKLSPQAISNLVATHWNGSDAEKDMVYNTLIQRKEILRNKILTYGQQQAAVAPPTVPKSQIPGPIQGVKELPTDAVFNDWVKTKWDPPSRKLTGIESNYLSNYQGSGYRSMNKAVRAGQGIASDHFEMHKSINDAIKTREVPEDVHVYRGVTKDFTHVWPKITSPAQLQGKYIMDAGIPSFSTSRDFAEDWVGVDDGVVLDVVLKKGQKALPIHHHTSNDMGEKELLLPSNTYMKVTKVVNAVGKHGRKWYITAEIV